MTKGFKFNKLIAATTQKILDRAIVSYVVYGGNFFMELVLPNAFKINSFKKLKEKLEKYIKSHGGKYPHQITVNDRQLDEYRSLFPGHETLACIPNKIYNYQGITLKLNKCKTKNQK